MIPNTDISILIVDDNPANLQILFETLRQAMYQVYMAQEGPMAVYQARKLQPDLILLDVNMPGIDGFEVCRRLKLQAETSDIPVIFLTVLDDTTDKVRGFDVGGVDFLSKPIDSVEVLARINTHLTIRNLRQSLAEKNEILQTQLQEYTAALHAERQQLATYQKDRQELLEQVFKQNASLRELIAAFVPESDQFPGNNPLVWKNQVQNNLEQLTKQLHKLQNTLPNLSNEAESEFSQALTLLEETQNVVSYIITFAPPTGETLSTLSQRESEVLNLVFEGKTSQEIGNQLGISDKTVRVYRSRIMQKLGVDNLADLIRTAMKQGLLKL
jgi:DNA-binding response OmpR family regulator